MSADWPRMTAPELGKRAAGCVALWALGSTEQHGPHLVTGFDHLVAEHIVERVAAELPETAVILPTLTIGASDHWVELGGTLSIPPQLLAQVIIEVCVSARAGGIERLVIVNGHAGNVGAGLLATASLAGRPAPHVEFVSYWELVDDAVLAPLLIADAGIGHAGEMETAIALHLGGLLRPDETPGNGRAATSGPGTPSAFHSSPDVARDTVAGVIGTPGVATAELGRVVVEHAINALVAHCRTQTTNHTRSHPDER